ncbi:MAG: molybdopterin-binding protein [Lachnospiraceae bacterium]
MKQIKTQDAVGHVLAHDITRIIKDMEKGPVFRKGHVVAPEDIPVLLSVGKEHLYVWERQEGMLHEDEAAEILCAMCLNDHMSRTEAKEGKIEIKAEIEGLFVVDRDRLNAVNATEHMMIATRNNYQVVKPGDKLAGTRIIPLVIQQEKMDQVRETAGEEPLLKLLPFTVKTAGIVTTGSEVFHGRIQDTFTPVVKEKLAGFHIETVEHRIVNDDRDSIVEAIRQMREAGVDLILCTGGMSVDPDDQTPGAIKASGADIVSYGAPVLPGAMFLLGYFEDGTPIVGLRAADDAKATIFDLVLPRLAAGLKVKRSDLTVMGVGGLCLGCETCHYPNCGFGKGQ